MLKTIRKKYTSNDTIRKEENAKAMYRMAKWSKLIYIGAEV